MPRQKFCSVPGCLSTTDVIKREQEIFLSAYCSRCSIQRPCRCPAPDIYTTRRETRTKFASWCTAIGLRSPGYYINVCYKHFSSGCPSRACPNPDVVKPAWEKPDKDKGDCEGDGGGPIARNKRNNLKRRRRPRSKVKEADEAAATTAVVSATVAAVDSTVMNRTSSLLRDALLGGPRAADSSGQRRLQLVQRPRQEQPPSLHHQASSAEGGQRQVIVMLTPAYSTLPTSIALPQTPVPLSQLTAATTTSNNNNNNSIHDNQISNKGAGTLNSVSSMTPPFSSGSSSTSTTRDNDDIMDDLMNIDDSMLFEMMDPKRLSEVADTRDLPGKSALSDSPLTLPLLDQSDDPCLNEGDSLSFVTDELDETVQKWMETCEGNFLPI